MARKLLVETPEISDPVELYGVYREYVKHEDELINRRQSWNLTLQGFLFAAYGVILQVATNPKSDPSVIVHFKQLVYVFPALGALVGIQVLVSIYAAQAAIGGLKKQWKTISRRINCSSRELFPELTGGSRRSANMLGKIPQLGIPGVIFIAWMVIAALTFW
jgi:hypothetical protein